MTGHWFGVKETWQASALGGSDVIRPLRRYAADKMSFGTKVQWVLLLPGRSDEFRMQMLGIAVEPIFI